MRAHPMSQSQRTRSCRRFVGTPLIAIGLLALVLAAPTPAETGWYDSPVTAAALLERREVVYVDETVENYQALLADIGAHVDVVTLDGRLDGIEQVARELAGRGPFDAIHWISHGTQAELQLGRATLTPGSMRAEHADALAAISRSLTEGADVLIYGCSFGRGASGREAAALLAQLTGADVAASDDPTGAEARGGDWDLEVVTGSIETRTVVTARAQADWPVLLLAITARETIDSDANGQIDHIKITTDQALNDNFADLTITVSGYAVTGYVTEIGAGGVNDSVLYVQLTESGTPDTGARPTVMVTVNTLLADISGTDTLDPDPPPDGKIAFNTNRDGDFEIYVMDDDGFNQINLTNNPATDNVPWWSPDGNKILFQSNRDGNEEVYVMDADGSNQTNLSTNAANDHYPTWSPDGSQIAFWSDRDGNGEIYVMDDDGTNQTRLTNNPAVDSSPAWSPDGSQIAFWSMRDGNAEVYVMDADGTNQANLTNNPAIDAEPSWSPDGSQIAFWSSRDPDDEIYVMDADGTNQTNLTNNAVLDRGPEWSSVGTRIAFRSRRDGDYEVYVMDADGTNQTNLTNNAADDFNASWFPGTMAIDAAPPVLLSAPSNQLNGTNVFQLAGEQVDFVFSETLSGQPTEAQLEAAWSFANGATDGDNLPSIGGGLDPFTFATTTSYQDTIRVTLNAGNTANTDLLLVGTHTAQVTVGTNITDTAGNPASTVPAGVPITGAAAGSYGFLKPITIDRTKIPSGCGTTLPDYPMLFNSTDSDLANAPTGNVTDPEGDDIVFRALDDATCGGAGLAPCVLDHEVERYVSGTGELVAWVRIPAVNTASAASDTVIYVYYGNSAVTTPTENPTGVWDIGYAGVWHLAENPGVSQALDSSSYGNHGSPLGAMDAADLVPGQIGDALDFDGTDDRIDAGSAASLDDLGPLTASAWIRPNDVPGDAPKIVAKYDSAAPDGRWYLEIDDSAPEADALEFMKSHPTTNLQVDSVNGVVSYGSWEHVAVTWDGSSVATNVHIFRNGVEVLYQQTTSGVGAMGSDAGMPMMIGGRDIASQLFSGLIDEVRISGIVRSSCWIGASYNNQVWPDKAVTPTPDPTPNPDDGFYGIGAAAATAVELVSFEAQGRDGAVDLVWETGTELDNLGFHLYRSLSESGPFERITASLIPGLGSSPEGARYGYRDAGRLNGVTYYYQLEDVETTGVTERHGPVWATPQPDVAGQAEAEEPDPSSEPGKDPAEGARSWIRYGDPEATSLRVVNRGRQHVVVELRTGGFWAHPDAEGGVWLSIPGFEEREEPGAPALPVRQAWLEAVAGRKVRLASVVGRDVVSFDGLRPGVAGEPELLVATDGTLHPGMRRRGAGRGFQAAGLYPEQPARVLGTAFQGDEKKVQLELAPLRWDRSTGRLLLARRLRVRLVFAGREKGERAFGGPRGRARRGGRGRVTDGVLARFAVVEPGLYAVRFEEVSGGRGSRLSDLSLTRRGEPVAFHVEPRGRRFGPGSVLFFESPGGSLNPYAAAAVYELSRGGAGISMPVASAAPAGATVPYYWPREELEVNRLYQPTLFAAPDRWLWDYVPSRQTKSYTFPASGLAPSAEPGRLELWLQGGSDYPADPDHHVRVSVNGQAVAEASWDGRHPYALDAALGSTLLREGENTLEITNLGDTQASYSLVMLDRFAVSYPRAIAGRGGELTGRFSARGTATVEGMAPDAFVLDVTETSPRWLVGATAISSGVSFAVEAGREYRMVSPEGLRRPGVRPAMPGTLRNETNRADYLVVGPRALLEAASPLLEQRRAQGLEPLAVAVEDVYDEFGFGEESPEALRDFFTHAYHRWLLGPRYVLLLGDATYDFKGYLNTGLANQVPPYMVRDTYMWTVSDPAYAAVNGEDLLPDLALGRLPAQDLEQARTLVDKVLTWERAGFDLSGRAVLVADNSDQAGDFEGDAERLAQTVLAGRHPERIYLSQLKGATRSTILDSFDRGSSLYSYIGHGSIPIWASENVFNIRDVPNLAPQAEQPLLLTMNCLNGYFTLPTGMNSLSEELLKAEDRGVIAAFSPSSMSLHRAARVYHEAFVSELVSGRHQRLGDALVAAQAAYLESGGSPGLLAIYQLLGDPALSIR